MGARDEAALCQQSDHRSVALRAKFGRPDGYKSCAIVGSSGLMLRSRLGAEIDAHEFVVRLVWMRGSNLLGSKLAATHPSHNTRGGAEPCARRRPGGHRGEQNVRAPDGSQWSSEPRQSGPDACWDALGRSLRVLNSEAIETALVERLCPELKALGQASCSSVNYAVYVNSNEETLKPSLQLACPSLRPALGREDLSPDDAVIRHFSGHGNVMTGAWGIALAMHLCPGGVDVYGFTHAGTASMSRGAQYHVRLCDSLRTEGQEHTLMHPAAEPVAQYYDTHGLRKGTDSVRRSAQLKPTANNPGPLCWLNTLIGRPLHAQLSAASVALTDLAAQQPACLRLHTPSNLTYEFMPPCFLSRPVTDLLVDGHPRSESRPPDYVAGQALTCYSHVRGPRGTACTIPLEPMCTRRTRTCACVSPSGTAQACRQSPGVQPAARWSARRGGRATSLHGAATQSSTPGAPRKRAASFPSTPRARTERRCRWWRACRAPSTLRGRTGDVSARLP